MAQIINAVQHYIVYEKKAIYLSSFGILTLICYLFFSFVSDIANYKDEKTKSDAIVVLTGGIGRIEEGAILLLDKRANYLILSGVNKGSDLKSILFRTKLDVDASKVIIDNDSANTYENAIIASRIIKDRGFRDIILVTSHYHMKRALYTFRRIIPEDVKIHAHPVSSPNFDKNKWWKNPTSIGIILFEFVKFYWYKVWI